MDQASQSKLAGVHPELAGRVRLMESALALRGIKIRVVSGYRSTEQQRRLYESRNTNRLPVAMPGTSKHEQALAVDLSPVGQATAAIWKAVGEEGKRVGLRWGGDFQRSDPPHFELQGKVPVANYEPISNSVIVSRLPVANYEPTSNSVIVSRKPQSNFVLDLPLIVGCGLLFYFLTD
jgi:hypothetical protein